MSRFPITRAALILLALGWPAVAAADALTGQTEQQAANWPAILMFSAFVLATLGITRWAAGRVRSSAPAASSEVELRCTWKWMSISRMCGSTAE